MTLLVNGAGVADPVAPTWEVSATEWWRTLEVNLRGVLLWVDAILPGTVAHVADKSSTIASNAGAYHRPNVSGHSVSTTAAIKLTENLALELRDIAAAYAVADEAQ